MHYKSAHLTVINRDRCFSQWSYEDVGEEEEKEIQETTVKNKLSWQKWQYIYKNVNYLHKTNGGSTAENALCHSEKQSFPTREKDSSVFGSN